MTTSRPLSCWTGAATAGLPRSAKLPENPQPSNGRFTAPASQCSGHRRQLEDRTACRSAHSSSAAGVLPPFAGLSGLQLERRCLHRATMGSEPLRRPRLSRKGAPRSHGHAALLRLPHGRLLPSLDQNAALARSTPRIFHVNWFRKDETEDFSGPASAKTCACSSGSSIASADARRQGDTHRLDPPLRGHGMERPGCLARKVGAIAGGQPLRVAHRTHWPRRTFHRPA